MGGIDGQGQTGVAVKQAAGAVRSMEEELRVEAGTEEPGSD